jgi:hypothetical protein
MPDSSAAFFEELARRGRKSLLEKATGTLRVELVDEKRTERLLVTLNGGEVAGSKRNGPTDCVVRTDRRLFAVRLQLGTASDPRRRRAR